MGGRAEGRTVVKLAKLDMRLSVRQLSGRSEPITFAVLLPCLALWLSVRRVPSNLPNPRTKKRTIYIRPYMFLFA